MSAIVIDYADTVQAWLLTTQTRCCSSCCLHVHAKFELSNQISLRKRKSLQNRCSLFKIGKKSRDTVPLILYNKKI